jgi:hypothetical protein
MGELTKDELLTEFAGQGYDQQWVYDQVNIWLARGDGIAVYRNEDLGHLDVGLIKIVSFGSPEAQLEDPEPPTQLPDIGGEINWRYQLHGTYRGEALP